MNEFVRLLKEIIAFVPLVILAFGVIFSLISLSNGNKPLLIAGLIIFMYGVTASYVRQIYKDLVLFLREENIPKKRKREWSDEEWKQLIANYPDYLRKWKRTHRLYYITQFVLLAV